eukprot:11232273-Heterocapsa_arctica.AAC.1
MPTPRAARMPAAGGGNDARRPRVVRGGVAGAGVPIPEVAGTSSPGTTGSFWAWDKAPGVP